MTTEIRVPELGESVIEATIAQWYKKPGDAVAVDEPLCELETDKVTVEVPAQSAGVLAEILIAEGETVEVGTLLGSIGEGDGTPVKEVPAETDMPAAAAVSAAPPKDKDKDKDIDLSPAVRRAAEEHRLDAAALKAIQGTGKGGRLIKEDILKAVKRRAPDAVPMRASAAREERVQMTRLRKTIATRLKASQNTAAQLTTFNEVDISGILAIRAEYKELFEQKYGVRLGFMSFFVRACVTALREIPAVNAEIDGDDIVYKNYVNMGIAVGTPKGLVVPVIKDVQDMGLVDIERAIGDYGEKARDGKLAIEDLQGGTFTISNGGVYGSLMSTPILNLPQSGVLGMHKIQERPVVVDGAIEVRPMMYLALSYDHRIVDGKEAVTFLVRLKESLEASERMLLDI